MKTFFNNHFKTIQTYSVQQPKIIFWISMSEYTFCVMNYVSIDSCFLWCTILRQVDRMKAYNTKLKNLCYIVQLTWHAFSPLSCYTIIKLGSMAGVLKLFCWFNPNNTPCHSKLTNRIYLYSRQNYISIYTVTL